MKDSLMHISLHLIWFHEIHLNYVKKNPSRTVVSRMNSKSVQFVTDRVYISKKNYKAKDKKKKECKPWLKDRMHTSAFNNMLAEHDS